MADHGCTHLRVEYLVAPLGIGTRSPRFSWQLETAMPGALQTAYELEVSLDGSDDILWSTGKVASADSTAVEYAGSNLRENTAFEWRVRTWISTTSSASEWATSRFETGFFDSTWWTASWIEPAQEPTEVERWSLFDWITGTRPVDDLSERLRPTQLLRQEFELADTPKRARLYATARGVYQAELNGHAVGDQVLAPGFDSYESRISVQCYDVTSLVRSGPNVLGVTVADGWWAGRIGVTGSSAQWGATTAATWQLEIEYEDGTGTRISSDAGSVRSHRGPHDWADLFIGERFDRRKEIRGWTRAGMGVTGWSSVSAASDQSKPLVAAYGEPVRRVMELPALSCNQDAAGSVVDFGQVVAGRIRISLPPLRSGTEIRIEHTEVLDPDGEWFVNIDGINKEQTDVYVAAGDPDGETYEPTFTFHGFRFIRISGLEIQLELDQITAVIISSDTAAAGTFDCSDERLNRLHQNVVWSQRANFLSIPTDCPQRERAGWSGDIQVFAAASTNNSQVCAFLTRWLENLRADQIADGRIPIFSPRSPFDDAAASSATGLGAIVAAAGWSDAITIVPWTLYERYGDRRVLEENYEAITRWIDYQALEARSGVPDRLAGETLGVERAHSQSLLYNTGDHFGDWLAPSTMKGRPLHEAIGIAPALTSEIVAPMFQFHSLDLAARIAGVLGRSRDRSDFETRKTAVRDAFVAEYVDEAGFLTCELQGPYVLALAFELVPDELRQRTAAHLVELIRDNGYLLDTGFLSVPYLLDVLDDTGHPDIARRLLWQTESPSWLYEVDGGATTIWESWDAIADDGTARTVSMNHYALGCVDDWLYRRVAGLAPLSPGYKTFVVRPDFDPNLTHASASIESEYGRIEVRWERDDEAITVNVLVPPNSSAVLMLGGANEHVGSGPHRRLLSIGRR